MRKTVKTPKRVVRHEFTLNTQGMTGYEKAKAIADALEPVQDSRSGFSEGLIGLWRIWWETEEY